MFLLPTQTAVVALLLGLAAVDGGVPPRTPSLLQPVIAGKREQPVQYQLRPVPGGGYEFDDPRFSAQVARDGRVSFSDHGLFSSRSWRLLPVLPEPHPPGTKTLEGTVRKMLGERTRPTEPGPDEIPVRHEPVAELKAPRSESDRKWDAEHPMLLLMSARATMDLTDEYYRLMGEDPYRREKARFLAATFDVRLAMAARAEAADLKTATAALPDRLAAIWADRSQPPAARRRIICALWTEVRRDGKGTAAAEIITTFVRTRLGAGTRDAYSPAELAACGEGQGSGPRFAPY